MRDTVGETIVVCLVALLGAGCSARATPLKLDRQAVFGDQRLPEIARLIRGGNSDADPPSACIGRSGEPSTLRSSYTHHLRVARGRNLRLEAGPVATVVDGERRSVDRLEVLPDRLYVHGRIRHIPGQGGYAIYSVLVRICSGPLAGSLIDLRDGVLPAPQNPLQAAYLLPATVRLEEGELDHAREWAFIE